MESESHSHNDAHYPSSDMSLNREVERIANLMLHDDISTDEQDPEKIKSYAKQVNLAACGISKSDADYLTKTQNIVYEALLYRKMKNSDHKNHNKDHDNILDRGSKFGAGFS